MPPRRFPRQAIRATLLGMSLLCAGEGSALARDDWQWWEEVTATVFTWRRYEASLYQQTRFRDDASDPYYVQTKVVNTVRLHPHLRAAANYSYVLNRGTDGHWRDEHRPELDLIPQRSFGPFVLEHRSRLEAQALEGDAGEVNGRYRALLQLTYAPPAAGGRVKLFASEEPFYTFPPDAWNQNRVFVGVTASPHRRLSLTAAWGIQSVRTGRDWDDRQLLFTAAKLTF